MGDEEEDEGAGDDEGMFGSAEDESEDEWGEPGSNSRKKSKKKGVGVCLCMYIGACCPRPSLHPFFSPKICKRLTKSLADLLAIGVRVKLVFPRAGSGDLG